MEESILKIKISLPPLEEHLYVRHDLLSVLDNNLYREQSFTRNLTLFSAPAGYGKTTLARMWLQQYSGRVAWFSLDHNDNQRERFWMYLIYAIRQAFPNIGNGSLALLRSLGMSQTGACSADYLLTPILNDLFELEDKFFLVLDDFHLIDTKEIQKDLVFFIEHLPQQFSLVVTTRSEPPWPLARWRSRRTMQEIRQSDLRLGFQDSEKFLLREKGLDLQADQVEILYRKTEGWITGLQLAAFTLKRSSDISRFVERLAITQRHIFHFLSQEVLEKIPEPARDILIDISILQRFCSSLCDYLCEREHSGRLLQDLEKENVFVMPVIHQGQDDWYRFHPLFADLLASNMRQKYSPAHICRLHVRAGSWFYRRGEYSEAIRHFLFAGENEQVALVFNQHLEEILHSEGPKSFVDCFAILTERILLSYPRLQAYKAWFCLVHRGKDAALECLASTKITEQMKSEMPDDIQGMFSVIHTYLSIYEHDMNTALIHAQQAWQKLKPGNSFWRTSIAVLSGDARLFASRPDEALPYYREAYQENKESENFYLCLSAGFKLATTYYFLGRLDKAEELTRNLLKLARREGLAQVSRVGLIWTLLGELMRERGNLEEAARCMQRGIMISEPEKPSLAWNYLFRVRLAVSQGNIDDGFDYIRRIAQIHENMNLPRFITYPAQIYKALLYLQQNNSQAASDVLNSSGVSADTLPLPGQEKGYLAAVLLRLNCCESSREIDFKAIRENLDDIAVNARHSQYMEVYLESRMLAALVSFRENELVPDYLIGDINKGIKSGYLQIFIDNRQQMKGLYAAAAQKIKQNQPEDQACREQLQKILGLSESAADTAQVLHRDIAAQANQDLIEPLSGREREILEFICQGMTNRAIAEKLYLSAGTVKWYTSNIYGKLGVSSRTEAALMAKKLELVN